MDKPCQFLTRGRAIGGVPALATDIRGPSAPPEGYLEAFATHYRQFTAIAGGEEAEYAVLLPTLMDGGEGREFVMAAVESSRNQSGRTRLGR